MRLYKTHYDIFLKTLEVKTSDPKSIQFTRSWKQKLENKITYLECFLLTSLK